MKTNEDDKTKLIMKQIEKKTEQQIALNIAAGKISNPILEKNEKKQQENNDILHLFSFKMPIFHNFIIVNKFENNLIYLDTILSNIINASSILSCEISNNFLILIILSSL